MRAFLVFFIFFLHFWVNLSTSCAQRKEYAWVTFDSLVSEVDTAANGTQAIYLQQYDTANIELNPLANSYIWTRSMAISTTRAMSLEEHQKMPEMLYSKYSYSAHKIEVDCKQKRYKTWQSMYFDDKDNPVSGLKLNYQRQVAWIPFTGSLKKLCRKVCDCPQLKSENGD
jgi:hypothetical protein